MLLAQLLNQSTLPTTLNTTPLVTTTAPATFWERIVDAFQTTIDSIIEFLPEVLAALFVVIIGWILAVLLGKLVRKLLSFTRVDKALDKVGFKQIREETGLELSVARFVGDLVKWFLIIVSVLAAADILQLGEISIFLRSILLYFPNVVVAVVIVIIGVLIGNFVQKIVLGAGRTAKLPSIPLIAAFARWSVIVFSVLAALVQLQVAASLIQILFTGIVAMIAIAGGLAFGLGGKDYANHLMEKFRRTAEDNSHLRSEKAKEQKEPMMGE
ncbi:MAG: hypothetical protein U0517_02740 [Candidatus Andersenbacteria bacterium]